MTQSQEGPGHIPHAEKLARDEPGPDLSEHTCLTPNTARLRGNHSEGLLGKASRERWLRSRPGPPPRVTPARLL